MATLTFKDKTKNALLKKFHTLLGRTGIGSDGKEAILYGYGVESSRDLTAEQLIEICNSLDMQLNPELAELDKARKRVFGAIGGWLQAMNIAPSNSSTGGGMIKAIACRAAGRERFNDIPLEQLRSLYSAFKKKGNDLAMVERLTGDRLDLLTMCN